jgi:hypothetical protein
MHAGYTHDVRNFSTLAPRPPVLPALSGASQSLLGASVLTFVWLDRNEAFPPPPLSLSLSLSIYIYMYVYVYACRRLSIGKHIAACTGAKSNMNWRIPGAWHQGGPGMFPHILCALGIILQHVSLCSILHFH